MTRYNFTYDASAFLPDPGSNVNKLMEEGRIGRESLAGRDKLTALGGDKAEVFVIEDFLSPEECARIVGVIDRRIGPSELFKGTEIDGFRTSSTHFFDPSDPQTVALEHQITGLLGLDHAKAEMMQGQRYMAGQQFKHHYDYFTVTEPYWQQERRRGGQRTWTAMVYLNEPEAGGATDFSALGIAVPPKTGSVLVWNNMDKSGRPNPNTMHAGTPVKAGSKYVITQWFRQDPWTLNLQ